MTVNLFADFDAMDDPYRIEGISGECLRAYHLAQDKSIPVEEREQWIKALIERTHAGDVNAEFCLGLLTRDDFSDELNAQKSELWFSSAAAQGHLYAAYHYALCLEKRGELEKAADAGVLRAQRRLVTLGVRRIRSESLRSARTARGRELPRELSTGNLHSVANVQCRRAAASIRSTTGRRGSSHITRRR